MAVDFQEHRRARNILKELAFAVTPAGAELRGEASVSAEMLVPGTDVLRTSILATWVDTIAGLRAADALAPQVPVTQVLDVQLHRPPAHLAAVRATARPLKAGRSVVVIEVELDADDGPVGLGTVSFMAAPAPVFELPSMAELAAATRTDVGRLAVPFAQRARCVRRDGAVAEIPLREDGRNASMTMNGGLLALAVEEAALCALPGHTLSSLAMHYLRPVRLGPAVATAEAGAVLARVRVHDAGAENRLAVAATVRAFAPDR
jgi:acyl-coenzyme A thioesterase PaaI-like protein